MLDASEVAALVERFNPCDDGEAAKSRELTLALLKASPDPFSRLQFNPGHITCSGLVVSPSGAQRGASLAPPFQGGTRNLQAVPGAPVCARSEASILLVLHRRLQRWLQPGGHVEQDDEAIEDVARREVIEETGARLRESSGPLLIGVDVHAIPQRPDEPFHLHHDLMFLLHASSEACGPAEEVRDVRWCAVAEFDRYQLPGSLRRAWSRAAGYRL
jgi:8-oxo-dGTP pyrophosphatase MutT (NUDIX family)